MKKKHVYRCIALLLLLYPEYIRRSFLSPKLSMVLLQ